MTEAPPPSADDPAARAARLAWLQENAERFLDFAVLEADERSVAERLSTVDGGCSDLETEA